MQKLCLRLLKLFADLWRMRGGGDSMFFFPVFDSLYLPLIAGLMGHFKIDACITQTFF